MKHVLTIAVLIAASSVGNAQTVYLNGQPCFVSGNQMTCPHGVASGQELQGQNEAARAQRAETARLRAQSKSLDDCLRKSDWPGSPGRSECEQMYGH